MMFDSLSQLPILQAIGLALVHSTWQLAALAILMGVSLRMLQGRSANARYLVCCVGMVLMLAAPVVTFVMALRAFTPVTQAFLTGVRWPGPPLPVAQGVQPWLPFVAALWAVGSAGLQLRLFVQWLRAERLRRLGTRPAPAWVQAMVDELCSALQVPRAVRVAESALVQVPAVVGWLSPLILVPSATLSGLAPEQLRAILAHELAHVRRHDYAVNLFQALLESLLFFHPATWWLSKRLREEREFCCDDLALQAAPGALNFAQALSSLEELRHVEAAPVLSSNGGSLMSRISRLLDPQASPSSRLPRWMGPAGVLLACALILPVVGAGCSDDPNEIAESLTAVGVENASELTEDALHTVKEQIHELKAAVERGELSHDEAVSQIKALVEEIHPDHTVHVMTHEDANEGQIGLFVEMHGEGDSGEGHIAGSPDVNVFTLHGDDDIKAQFHQIKEALASGEITEDEAHVQMRALKEELHEHLMTQDGVKIEWVEEDAQD